MQALGLFALTRGPRPALRLTWGCRRSLGLPATRLFHHLRYCRFRRHFRELVMPILRFIPEATNIDFVGARYVAFAIDGLLLVISIVSIFWWHGFNLGIDFKGGVQMEVKSAQVIDVAKMRSEVGTLGLGETNIVYFGGTGQCNNPVNSCVMIRVLPQALKAGQDENVVEQTVASAVKAKLGPAYTFQKVDMVGPKVSQELYTAGVE